ncbi:hypothetical protein M422DRAFT_25098 [Sphaerobolus stellatus SS14]|nr:hypothetical protein M422DRAFT_25098 [Sphaerobolus stellatus SS14]
MAMRPPAFSFVPSTSMPRGPAVPPTMRCFHPHVKGLSPPPAIYAPAHLSISMPFVDRQASTSTSTPCVCTPSLYLGAMRPLVL